MTAFRRIWIKNPKGFNTNLGGTSRTWCEPSLGKSRGNFFFFCVYVDSRVTMNRDDGSRPSATRFRPSSSSPSSPDADGRHRVDEPANRARGLVHLNSNEVHLVYMSLSLRLRSRFFRGIFSPRRWVLLLFCPLFIARYSAFAMERLRERACLRASKFELLAKVSINRGGFVSNSDF